MTLTTVPVALGARSYDILIGQGALEAGAPRFEALLDKGRAAVVADETVWSLHGPAFERLYGQHPVIIVPPGEGSKSFDSFARVTNGLIEAEVGRDGLVIAFGGGVVGDLAGFCAATLRRGCRFVQIPTTLLAQVDSSVGGKTAINAPGGKNLVGAFHQPSLVIADLELLASLPDRELKAGYAEVVKYGLLGDRAFFDWLAQHGSRVLAREPEATIRAIEVSCRAKAATVAADETERGNRALLNLGHTFGHALEAAMGYDGRLLHGEAVAAGMAMAFRFSAREGLCPETDARAVADHLAAMGLPTGPRDIKGLHTDADAQLGYMYQDKKVEGGALTLILTRAIGEAYVAKGVDPGPLTAFLTDELKGL